MIAGWVVECPDCSTDPDRDRGGRVIATFVEADYPARDEARRAACNRRDQHIIHSRSCHRPRLRRVTADGRIDD